MPASIMYDQYGKPQIVGGPSPKTDFFKSDTYATMQKLMPEYGSIRNADGTLQDPFKLGFTSNMPELQQQLAGINLDTRGLDALRTEGLRPAGTPSAWAQMMLSKQMGDAAAQNQAGVSSAMSALASRGGVSRGARERIASKGARDLMMSRQKAGMDVGLADEGNRLDILKMLPGAEVAALQPALAKTNIWASMANTEAARQQDASKFNIANAAADLKGKNDYALAKYQETMKAYGADRTAQAQENAGK